MRQATVLAAAVALHLALPGLAAAGGSRQAPLDRAAYARAAAGACARALSPARSGACRTALGVTRTPLTGGVAHYAFDLPVGPGELDVIRIHRVVREAAPWLPAPAPEAVLLVHGTRTGFEPAFLTAAAVPSVPDDQAFPVFLAAAGVDVWGVDMRWILVPPGLTDLTPLAGWDLGTEVGDLGAALAVARITRTLTGSGPGRLHLLGFSRGGQLAYAYMNEESQLPPLLRHVEGFIVGDIFLETDVEDLRLAACQELAGVEARIAAGEIADDGTFLNLLGDLAATAPDDPSPFLPGVTNAALARLIGFDAPPQGNVVPFFHQVAGDFVPPADADLLYTRDEIWFSAFRRGAAYLPLASRVGLLSAQCDAADVPWDDHLGDVTVPVLYLGAGGGVGEYGLYNLRLLGSTDVTVHLVDLEPPELRGRDYGHQDLFLADDAGGRAWEAVLAWIEAH